MQAFQNDLSSCSNYTYFCDNGTPLDDDYHCRTYNNGFVPGLFSLAPVLRCFELFWWIFLASDLVVDSNALAKSNVLWNVMALSDNNLC